MENNESKIPSGTNLHISVSARKSQFLIIGISAFVLLGLGILIGYFLFSNGQKQTINDIQKRSSTVIENTHTSASTYTSYSLTKTNISVPCTYFFPKDKEYGVTNLWKSYTNTKYGFSIKYPQNWQTQASSNDKEVAFAEQQTPQGIEVPYITIYVYDKNNKFPQNELGWQSGYEPFYAAHILYKGNTVYVFRSFAGNTPLDGGAQSDERSLIRNRQLDPEILCGMLSTFNFTN